MFLCAGGEDYVSASVNLKVDRNATEACIVISLLSDNRLEYPETFTVYLNTSETAVLLEPLSCTVVILDDDGKIYGCGFYIHVLKLLLDIVRYFLSLASAVCILIFMHYLYIYCILFNIFSHNHWLL